MKSRLILLALIMSAAFLLACSGMDFLIKGMWYPKSFAVTLGDVDGDGDLDAFVANGHTDDTGEKNTIWLNDGTGHFADTGQRLGDPCCNSNDSRAVSLGDLDNDGDLDAFVGNYNGYNAVWVNDGKGNFVTSGQRLTREQGTNSRPAMHSVAVALGDLDADGDLDAFVGNCCRTTGAEIDSQGVTKPLDYVIEPYDTVWLNNGGVQGGTLRAFGDSGQFLGPTETQAVALGDLDGDGDLDVFVGNNKGQANRVWMNDGTAQFSDSGQELGHADSYAVALGDIDGDGDLDAFVGNDGANEVWLNGDDGALTNSGQSLGSDATEVVALKDLDGDGDLDAFVGNGTSVEFWWNDGSGKFSDGGQHLKVSDKQVVALGDVDGDGAPDVLSGSFDQGCRVWHNDGAGPFGQQGRRQTILDWLVDGSMVIPGLGVLLFVFWQRPHNKRIKPTR